MSKARSLQTAQSNLLTVDDLARAYTLNRDALVRRATRKLSDQALAEEIVQETFLKVILAAPEISTEAHLLAYLNTTVNNLCISQARASGSRPDLVAIDSDMTSEQITALLDENQTELDSELIRAEDSAIVREAISRLSETDRAVLLAETYEGLSAADISERYGMTQESVHVAISRARKNLRTILETWIVDEATGMTAAEFLSKTYKKATANSKKIGSAALSVVMAIAAFFGLWNQSPSSTDFSAPNASAPNAAAPNVSSPDQSGSAVETPEAAATAPVEVSVSQIERVPQNLEKWAVSYLSKVGPLGWPGLDAQGIPVGFTVNDGAGLSGLALISQDPFTIDFNKGTVTSESRFTTFQNGVNVIVNQKVVNNDGVVSYLAEPIVRVRGSWIALSISSRATDIKQLDDGTFLITCWMIVDLDATALNKPIAGLGLGNDLTDVPAVIATRIRTTSIGSPILGQATQVLGPWANQ